MITPTEYYLSCVAEECEEVAQRVQKAIRFGLFEVQPGQELNNWQRLAQEWDDLLTAMDLLIEKQELHFTRADQKTKREKIAFYLEHAKKVGQVRE